MANGSMIGFALCPVRQYSITEYAAAGSANKKRTEHTSTRNTRCFENLAEVRFENIAILIEHVGSLMSFKRAASERDDQSEIKFPLCDRAFFIVFRGH
jgi:hypothetical protein